MPTQIESIQKRRATFAHLVQHFGLVVQGKGTLRIRTNSRSFRNNGDLVEAERIRFSLNPNCPSAALPKESPMYGPHPRPHREYPPWNRVVESTHRRRHSVERWMENCGLHVARRSRQWRPQPQLLPSIISRQPQLALHIHNGGMSRIQQATDVYRTSGDRYCGDGLVSLG